MNESIIEDATLSWFEELGYQIGHGPHIAPGEVAAERSSFGLPKTYMASDAFRGC